MTDLRPLLQWIDANQPPGVARTTQAEDVANGQSLLNALVVLSPGDFGDVELRHETGDNWVMRRGNLNKILDACTAFAVKYLNAPENLDVTSTIDSTALARDNNEAAAAALLSFVTTIIFLGGGDNAVNRARSLPKTVQQQLSAVVKQYGSQFQMKKRKAELSARTGPSPVPTASPTTAEPAPAVQRSYGQNQIDEEILTLTAQKNELADNLAASEALAKQKDEKMRGLQTEYDRLHQQYQALLESNTASETVKVRELKKDCDAKDETVRKLRSELDTQRRNDSSKIDELTADRDKLREALRKTEEQLQKAKDQQNEVASQLKFTRDVTEAHAKSKGSLESHIAEIERDCEAATKRADIADAEKAELMNKMAAMEATVQASETKIASLEHQIDMLHHHSSPPPAPMEDVSPQPKKSNSDEAAAELTRKLEELERKSAAQMSEIATLHKHLAAANKQRQPSPTNGDSQRQVAELDKATAQLREELGEERDRFRAQRAGLTAMVFKAGQRNLALSAEVHRQTGRIPDLLSTLNRGQHSADEPMSFLQRTKLQLEMGALLNRE
jgi:DNA repair exonuclease SbcCD ATPase subunit